MAGVLVEVVPGIDDESFARNAGRHRALDAIAKKRDDLCRDIVVMRARRLAARRRKAVGKHERCGAVGKDRRHARVIEPARIVDDARPRFNAPPRDLGTVSVHRDHHIRSSVDRLDQRHHPIELLVEADGGTASEGYAADVHDIRAVAAPPPLRRRPPCPSSNVDPLSKKESGVRLMIAITATSREKSNVRAPICLGMSGTGHSGSHRARRSGRRESVFMGAPWLTDTLHAALFASHRGMRRIPRARRVISTQTSQQVFDAIGTPAQRARGNIRPHAGNRSTPVRCRETCMNASELEASLRISSMFEERQWQPHTRCTNHSGNTPFHGSGHSPQPSSSARKACVSSSTTSRFWQKRT